MFSKTLHDILHFVNIPPNYMKKNIEFFYSIRWGSPFRVLYVLTLKE
jgi:hypothetical protein